MATKASLPKVPVGSRIAVPKSMREAFLKDPRIVVKWRPDGIWPIGPEMLRDRAFVESLLKDKEFLANYEIVATPRV